MALKGGEGTLWKVIVAVYALGVLANGMQLINLGAYPQYIAKGIIMLASLCDGHGGEDYYKSIRDAETIQSLYDQILATPQEQTPPDQWCVQIYARIAKDYKVIYVADKEQKQLVLDLKAEYAETLDEAYARARELKGPDASLTCIPNGISVIVKD